MSAVISGVSQALSLINTSLDSVAVFDQAFNQVFPQARALKATIKEEAKVMEHPVETGATITDHRVILPIEIELSMMVFSADYQDVYNSIKQYYLNSTLLIVQTWTSTYLNQLIAAIPHEEDPQQFKVLNIAIKLKEVLFVTSQSKVVPKNPSNNSTTNRGNIQPNTVSPERGSSILIDAGKVGKRFI
jgi:hypothetical protein